MAARSLSRVLAKPLRAVLWLVMAVIIVKAVSDGLALHDSFGQKGNDDIMRMLSVRDLIAGQAWYDMVQYRLLPPDGVSLHWSRYIDAGIAAIILPLSLFVPMQSAEILAAIIWPTLILFLTVLVVAFGTQRVFGKVAACFAVLCVGFWPLTADLHASAGNLDHHNVQLLMMVVLAFAVVWPSRPVVAGIVGGSAAAFSLAIGLEGLPFIVGAGIALFVRTVFVQKALSRTLLVSFCVTLAVSCVVFMMGQTAPAHWGQPVCDQLGMPTLALVAVAVGACLLPLAVARWVQSPVWHLGATIILTGVGLALMWPLLSGCLDGPYGDLPLAVQDAISARITEARPGLAYARIYPGAALVFVIPVLVSLLAGAGIWAFAFMVHGTSDPRNRALGLLLILCGLGAAMIFVQMRTVIMVACVVPMIGGYVAATFVQSYLEKRDLAKGLLAIAVAAAITAPVLFVTPFAPWLERDRGDANARSADCRATGSLAALNAVPPATVLAHTNFGPALIWGTHHFGMSAPYHRSAVSLSNGILPFDLAEQELAVYLRASGATYFLLCRGYDYESDFVDRLANGAIVDWLRPVSLPDEAQMLFVILPQ